MLEKLSKYIASADTLLSDYPEMETARSTDKEEDKKDSVEMDELLLQTITTTYSMKPQLLECMFQTNGTSGWNSLQMSYMPVIPIQYLQQYGHSTVTPNESLRENNPLNTILDTLEGPLNSVVDRYELDTLLRQHSETLLGEILNIGSLLGYQCGSKAEEVSSSARYIRNILDAGGTYLTSEGGKLMVALAINRSMLPLKMTRVEALLHSQASDLLTVRDDKWEGLDLGQKDASITQLNRVSTSLSGAEIIPLPANLMKRVKDMPRIFRNKVKRPLSLRLNSSFDHSLAKLRQHHGTDCWVGSQLEEVWRYMAAQTPPQLLIFELWYGNELIAADFAHPCNEGLSVYVATRFYERESTELRSLMPGFLLALAECCYLQTAGCRLWDLGGISGSPLMQYKLDLTGTPYHRAAALGKLDALKTMRRKGKAPLAMGAMRNGVLLESIGLENLLTEVLLDNE